ncbi:hypothetical protein K1719_016546 [Acacia pycnantha]|nr:hypothetical protein K1719_016546 [Acacia pycnantha]
MYNLSTDSWRKLDDDVSIYKFRHSSMGPYWNGAYHWLVSRREDFDNFIVRFDFSKEAFGIIQSPPGITSSPMENTALAIVDKSLAWAVRSVSIEVCLEIWVMNEYNVENSWTKKLEIRPLTYSYSWYILQFWVDHEIIVYDDINCQLISYNFRNEQTERLKDDFRTMMDYVESLFP